MACMLHVLTEIISGLVTFPFVGEAKLFEKNYKLC